MANKTYTVTLTSSENKAMEHIAYSVQDWVDNSIHNRARQAIDQIYDKEVERMTNDDSIDSIPANKEQVVLDANIQTAKQITDESQSEADSK
jgi:hypothetical protein